MALGLVAQPQRNISAGGGESNRKAQGMEAMSVLSSEEDQLARELGAAQAARLVALWDVLEETFSSPEWAARLQRCEQPGVLLGQIVNGFVARERQRSELGIDAAIAVKKKGGSNDEAQAAFHKIILPLPAAWATSTIPTRVAAPSSRPRERRATGRARARAPSSSDDGPQPPPLDRVCRGCGREFETREPRRRYCDDRCKSRTLTTQHRDRLRGEAEPSDVLLTRYRDEVAKARRRGELNDVDALELLVEPSERVLAMLAAA